MTPATTSGKTNGRPKVGIFGLTGCAGDQLQILNCEDELVRLSQRLDIVDWVMAKSDNDHTSRLDVAFVEGVVATQKDLDTLKEIRARSRVLVAIGTCAVWGGLPAMRNELPREVLAREVYKKDVDFLDTVEARPASDFVPFEVMLAGCPMERHEFLKLVNSLLLGTRAELPRVPVCWECKSRENLCRVIYFKEVCCGAMTRAGCGARCPSHGVACAGCRGPVDEVSYDANITMFKDRGISWMEIARRMESFSAPAWMKLGLEKEVRK
jgi:coenzyme F420-reducing hydrogenase gamma subunit